MDFLYQKKLLDKLSIVDWGYSEDLDSQSFSSYQKWVGEKKHYPLLYLEGERGEKRKSVKEVFHEVKSSLTFLISYSNIKFSFDKFLKERKVKYKLGAFSLGFQGFDYHYFIPHLFQKIEEEIKKNYPSIKIFNSLDTKPIMERDLAFRSGLGWFGKNSMLIHKEHGSYTMIYTLYFSETLFLPIRSFSVDHCGQCQRCLEACPTEAIIEGERLIDVKKCISTFTVEIFKEAQKVPKGYTQSSGEIFGCDICQEVCPWNKRIERQGRYQEINIEEHMLKNEKFRFIVHFFLLRKIEDVVSELTRLSNRQYRKIFSGTSFERIGRVGMLKNLKPFLNKKTSEDGPGQENCGEET